MVLVRAWGQDQQRCDNEGSVPSSKETARMHKEGPVPASTARRRRAVPSVREAINSEFWQATIGSQR